MTETEWRWEIGRPLLMAIILQARRVPRTKAGRRKLRLFACGCCRVAWDVLPDDQLRFVVCVAEQFADGLASKADLTAARGTVEGLTTRFGPYGDSPTAVRVAIDMAVAATEPHADVAALAITAMVRPFRAAMTIAEADTYLCNLTRCVFGNPFRPPTFETKWRSAAVTDLARGIYDARAFDGLPILADALQEAGCKDEVILPHCRGPGPHARGCWVVDLALGIK